jgi:hypothetical protein
LAYRPPFLGHAANLKSLRYLAVHPSIRQLPKFWSVAPPQNDATWMFTRDGRNSPRVWESITSTSYS